MKSRYIAEYGQNSYECVSIQSTHSILLNNDEKNNAWILYLSKGTVLEEKNLDVFTPQLLYINTKLHWPSFF